jgi:CBS domain-containing protein
VSESSAKIALVRVGDVMTRDVHSVTAATSLKEVARTLAELRISGVPVVDGEQVIGVVSEADILFKEQGERAEHSRLTALRKTERRVAERKLTAVTAGEAMSSPALTIVSERPVAEAAATMIKEGVNRLPVVDEEGRLVGIVSRADLVRAFVRPDDDIAREVEQDVLIGTFWISQQVAVSVQDGAVTLSGRVDTNEQARLLPEFVRRVPGVVSVTSQLTWPE